MKWVMIIFVLMSYQTDGKYTPAYDKVEVPMPSARVCQELAFGTRDRVSVYAYCEGRWTDE